MKRVQKWLRALIVLPLTLGWAVLAFAQDQAPKVDVSSTTTTSSSSAVWYTNWWVWAAGVAVFLIVVIALTTRGGRNSA